MVEPGRVRVPLACAALSCTVLNLVAAGAAASPPPVFAPATTVLMFNGDEVGGLSELETGDVNADGITDVVVTRLAFPIAHRTFPVGILLGDGRGGFNDGSSLWEGAPPRTQHGRQILIADFNGDRRNDIFVADHGYDLEPFPGHRSALALSTSAGKLVDATANLPPEPAFSHSAAAADVDRDGDVDIFVGNIEFGGKPSPEILLNDGSGRFTRRAELLPAELLNAGLRTYTRALFVDANLDGAPDLVLGAFQALDSEVALNDGAGRFRLVPHAMPPKALGPTSILISLTSLDINRDGRSDLLAGFQGRDFRGRRVQVLIGNGDGTFRDETAARLPTQDQGEGWPHALGIADVDGDGSLDFAVSVFQAPSERGPLYLNDGTGVFSPVALPAASQAFLFLDANRDGSVDLYSALAGGPGGTERHLVQLQIRRPAKPTRVRATRNRPDRIVVTWSAVPGASRYEVWRARSGSTRGLVARVTAIRFDDRGAARRVSYSYTVRAVNELGAGGFSAPAMGKRR